MAIIKCSWTLSEGLNKESIRKFFFFLLNPFVLSNVRISHGHENQEYLSKLLLH
jgi:hypothetical protein